MRYRYLIALGSNVRHARHGSPRAVVRAALVALGAAGVTVKRVSCVRASNPLGPSRRRYANGAAIMATDLDPLALLSLCKQIERAFGRRSRSRAWSARVLDIDIVLWSGGIWASDELVVPHPEFRNREFVLEPARDICPDWRDPLTGRTVRQLHWRLTRPVASRSCSLAPRHRATGP
ncbi:MAG TPA: 2-amino-4-hydroxy-6-hydroxymethyldihydropteridine diphosphokinase [Novosphingobium sp.]|nr:2-amino-4-hydroxy-6-hydroxymethyldihydropteridine diphosphokinase [Novosphingobium sp.]